MFCGLFSIPTSPLAANLLFASHDRLPLFRPIAHYASTHSSLATTNLVHCALTTRCQHSIQLDNQPKPLRTPQQDHSPTHQPTVILSTATYLLTLTLAYDDQVEPLPAPDILGEHRPSCPHFHFVPLPTHRRQFDR